MRRIYYMDDCLRLQRRLRAIGYDATLLEVQNFWEWHSEYNFAGWLILDNDDRGEKLQRFVERYLNQEEGLC